ncbi:hypothetical protein [Capnocytophaga stomatis]|uniref:Uncharacterized protein n=1 Tax=Capnocytophaga stomatis TaxID=1848904 RepID=A0ABW8QD48_9FLAO|nr:hypothetical protein [Capnocytophaga stomatis]GIM49741.1 hypothetical protein CAPN003_11930 [Capnocytophaga stomatis]
MEKCKVNTRNKRVSMLLLSTIGFLLGVAVYLFGLMVSNSETSLIDPTFKELLRNVDYFILFVYGIIGLVTLYMLIKLSYQFKRIYSTLF